MQNVNRVEELPNNTVSATKRIRYKDIIREVRSLGVPPHMKGSTLVVRKRTRSKSLSYS